LRLTGNWFKVAYGLKTQEPYVLTGTYDEAGKPLPSDDPKQRRPDITLAKEKLGWSPEVSLEEGLQKTIAYFDALL